MYSPISENDNVKEVRAGTSTITTKPTTSTTSATQNPKQTALENKPKKYTQADVFYLQAKLLKAQLGDQNITTKNLKLSNMKLKLQIQLLTKINEKNGTLTFLIKGAVKTP